jgi:CheY-like chemotaxis protein
MEPRRVLVIEDEPDVLEVIRLSLELIGGWQVTGAASGEAGLAAARACAPDAILLDVSMPEQDGPATLRALRGDPALAGIPAIFITARAARDAARLRETGALGVVAKPFDPLHLPAEVAALLGWEVPAAGAPGG